MMRAAGAHDLIFNRLSLADDYQNFKLVERDNRVELSTISVLCRSF